jgi:hypothetical protein
MFYIKCYHHTLYVSKSFNEILNIYNIVRSERPHLKLRLSTSDDKIVILSNYIK